MTTGADSRQRWNPATDPEVDEATRERWRAATAAPREVSDHALLRWSHRAPEHAMVAVGEAWREADPVHYPPAANGAVARYHAPTDMILLARMGALVSCVSLADREQDTRVYVRNQVSDL